MIIPVFDRVENIVGKGENADNQHFLLFPQCFQVASSSGILKLWIVWKRLNPCFPDQESLGVRGREEKRRTYNQKVLCSIPGSGCQLSDFHWPTQSARVRV